MWRGPADLPRSLTLEWRLTAIRWLGVLSVAPALLLLHLPPDQLPAAYAILLAGCVYNAALQFLLPRRPALFASGYVTTALDSLLNVGMVLVAGGFDSPFAYLLFTVTTAVAMRYGYGSSLAMASVFIACDLLEKAVLGRTPDGPLAFRGGFLVITALLASYLRSQAREAEAALQDRLVEVERLYADLEAAHRELLGVDEMKTTFLANVSHELRTPLTSIRAFSELLLTYDDDRAVREEFLTIINGESDRLARLVDDVLDITRIESGRVEWRMTTFDLAALLRDAAEEAAPLMARQGLAFVQSLPETLPVHGDHDRLRQVVGNLLSNAAKFSSSGTVTLAAEETVAAVCVSVRDEGTGIAVEDLARIFDKFQQVGSTLTGKPTGTGLGLAICRAIVTHHGGSLSVTSTPGEGSTFTMTLPR